MCDIMKRRIFLKGGHAVETVRIIGGRAGRLLPHILPQIDRARRAGTRVLLLVPEQYTLQAERELISGLQLPGLMDIEVLSPRRLVRRIREVLSLQCNTATRQRQIITSINLQPGSISQHAQRATPIRQHSSQLHSRL